MKTKGKYQHGYTKTCVVCGEVFYPSRRKNVACSRKCGASARSGPRKARTTITTCTECFKPITRPLGKALRWERHFCNPQCKGSWMAKQIKGSSNPNFKNLGFWECQSCGLKYTEYSHKGRFCDSCRPESRHKTGENSTYALGRRYEILCAMELERLGYFVVKTRASRGPFDLLAIKGNETLLVQVKKSNVCIPHKSSYRDLIEMEIGSSFRKQAWLNSPSGEWIVKEI